MGKWGNGQPKFKNTPALSRKTILCITESEILQLINSVIQLSDSVDFNITIIII